MRRWLPADREDIKKGNCLLALQSWLRLLAAGAMAVGVG
jgi:hypothetical protein